MLTSLWCLRCVSVTVAASNLCYEVKAFFGTELCVQAVSVTSGPLDVAAKEVFEFLSTLA